MMDRKELGQYICDNYPDYIEDEDVQGLLKVLAKDPNIDRYSSWAIVQEFQTILGLLSLIYPSLKRQELDYPSLFYIKGMSYPKGGNGNPIKLSGASRFVSVGLSTFKIGVGGASCGYAGYQRAGYFPFFKTEQEAQDFLDKLKAQPSKATRVTEWTVANAKKLSTYHNKDKGPFIEISTPCGSCLIEVD